MRNQQTRERSETERAERKQRVLSHATPAITSSIASAVVIKHGGVYFLSTTNGDVPLEEEHGFGLYLNDCRFLNGYELRIAGCAAVALASTAARGYMSTIELSNPDLRLADGTLVPKEALSVRWEHVADGHHAALYDRLTFTNFGVTPVSIPVALAFRAEFEDLFVVRGMVPEHVGTYHGPRWRHGALEMEYDGLDGLRRALRITLTPSPQATDDGSASFTVDLAPRGTATIDVSIALIQRAAGARAESPTTALTEVGKVVASLEHESRAWLARLTTIESDSELLGRVLSRSLRDLDMLRTPLEDAEFFAAGVPWFVALFGRDSIITALQTLAFDATIAEQTLRLLARFQATTVDEWREAQPGRILHELRVGELTRAGEIPYSPYYGTVDATPLFLVLLGRHAAWTGDLALFAELRGTVERALAWIDRFGDSDGDGYLDYRSKSGEGLVNQGWKDSGNAIVDALGNLATPPIAMVEVQGYVFLAKRLMADLYRRSGELSRAEQLEREAATLRERFNRDFWLDEIGCYVMALQRDMVPAAVVSSNAGHTLWSGIADVELARRTMERLMAADMFNGWGIRTLSSEERRYHPVSYHLGTVWPHDNAIIAAGFRRYGFDGAAQRIFSGIIAAALEFEHDRLPELFAGFSREDFGVPVRYPVADHPQAWGAGSVPYLLVTMLGLVPDAFERRLRVVRPLLPHFVDRLRMTGVRVGPGRVDLAFVRNREDSAVSVEVLQATGGVDVVVDHGPAAKPGADL